MPRTPSWAVSTIPFIVLVVVLRYMMVTSVLPFQSDITPHVHRRCHDRLQDIQT